MNVCINSNTSSKLATGLDLLSYEFAKCRGSITSSAPYVDFAQGCTSNNDGTYIDMTIIKSPLSRNKRHRVSVGAIVGGVFGVVGGIGIIALFVATFKRK